MAPPRIPKRPLKSPEKLIKKPISKIKRTKKRNYQSFSIYLYKILKSVTQHNLEITKKSMLIMNNFINDMLEKIAAEAGRLVGYSKKTTISRREIQTAVRLLVPGELAIHGHIEASKAVRLYYEKIV